MDYKDISIKADGEYEKTKGSLKTCTIILVVFSVAGVGILAGGIAYFIKTAKREGSEVSKEEVLPQQQSVAQESSNWKCLYCGCLNEKTKVKKSVPKEIKREET